MNKLQMEWVVCSPDTHRNGQEMGKNETRLRAPSCCSAAAFLLLSPSMAGSSSKNRFQGTAKHCIESPQTSPPPRLRYLTPPLSLLMIAALNVLVPSDVDITLCEMDGQLGIISEYSCNISELNTFSTYQLRSRRKICSLFKSRGK